MVFVGGTQNTYTQTFCHERNVEKNASVKLSRIKLNSKWDEAK